MRRWLTPVKAMQHVQSSKKLLWSYATSYGPSDQATANKSASAHCSPTAKRCGGQPWPTDLLRAASHKTGSLTIDDTEDQQRTQMPQTPSRGQPHVALHIRQSWDCLVVDCFLMETEVRRLFFKKMQTRQQTVRTAAMEQTAQAHAAYGSEGKTAQLFSNAKST